MATNENGNLLDDAGRVAVDFVWGNIPLQPNDVRLENGGGLLDTTANLNIHEIAYQNWNGYPLVIDTDNDGVLEGTAGPEGAGYVVVPSVLGVATALASRILVDDGFVVTTAAGATNTATQPTGVNATTTTSATITIAGGTSTWAVGTKVTITAGTGIPAAVVGTFSVTGGSGSTIIISGTGFTVANSGAITPGTVLKGAAATIKSQSVAAGADSTVVGAAITITPWAA